MADAGQRGLHAGRLEAQAEAERIAGADVDHHRQPGPADVDHVLVVHHRAVDQGLVDDGGVQDALGLHGPTDGRERAAPFPPAVAAGGAPIVQMSAQVAADGALAGRRHGRQSFGNTRGVELGHRHPGGEIDRLRVDADAVVESLGLLGQDALCERRQAHGSRVGSPVPHEPGSTVARGTALAQPDP